MEYQGIVTGIGQDGINEITPEIDAITNKFIIGANGILEGLFISQNGLTKGMCILHGYRGVLENDIQDLVSDWVAEHPLSVNFYVYGRFIINFDKETVDSFDIVTDNNYYNEPEEIDSSGTYYLMLYSYNNGFDDEAGRLEYPLRTYNADNTDFLRGNGRIGNSATTNTQEVNTHLTYPLRIANTEYVHNQIEEELRINTITAKIYRGTVETNQVVTFYRKAKMVTVKMPYLYLANGYNTNYSAPTFTIPEGYIPSESIKFIQAAQGAPWSTSGGGGQTSLIIEYNVTAYSSAITATIVASLNGINGGNPNDPAAQGITPIEIQFGYKCE